jgi:Chaperone for flagella basal body P-ring formation
MLPTAALLVLANTALTQDLMGSRYPISESSIAKELGDVGVNVNASQVHLLAHMSAAVASPKLEIVRAQSLEDNQVRIELRCLTAEECLPFFARLDVKDANLVSAKIRLKTSSATVGSHQASVRIGGEPVSKSQLRVGSHAVLTIRDGHLDIHLQVLAIDSGAIGQQVRVCTLDRKKVFHATVTGESTVTGGIE